jgi:Na+-transporting methylmalonyl-CoA/oxaloacetate decarboxylase gamma subunit
VVDWDLAFKVVGVGFVGVFLVLSMVALMMWLTGLLLHRLGGSGGGGEDNNQKGWRKWRRRE